MNQNANGLSPLWKHTLEAHAGSTRWKHTLEAHAVCRISAVSLLEAHIVVRAREHHTMPGKLQRFLEEIGAIVMPFDEQQAHLANEASRRYGKGQGHPAQLNMGDCAVYALAKLLDEPLLFVGNDFSQTDIKQC